MADTLFDKAEFALPVEVASVEASAGVPRLRVPQRQQVEMHYAALDELLESDHPVRAIWALVLTLDLSAWLREFKAVEGACGRDGTDPRLLLALWVYATIEGVASGRELARRCEMHLAYRWLCGGVTVNHRLLSEFRSHSGTKLDDLLTKLVAALMSENRVTLQRVAQDGLKVRAHAGQSSFRKRERLEQCLAEAKAQVETLKQLADAEPQELNARQQAARQRAAEERQTNLEQALKACEEVEQQRQRNRSRHRAKPARASTTDPDARIMQMPDKGFRPAYNVQFVTDVASGIIVGVDVVNTGSDNGQLRPLAEQLQRRYGRGPEEYLADGGFTSFSDIEYLENERQCAVYLPLKDEQKKLAAGLDPSAATKRDTEGTKRWRTRMATDAAKAIYKLRAQSAEWVNAICRNRNLRQLPVRGLERAKAVARLQAFTHNLLQSLKLRPATA